MGFFSWLKGLFGSKKKNPRQEYLDELSKVASRLDSIRSANKDVGVSRSLGKANLLLEGLRGRVVNFETATREEVFGFINGLLSDVTDCQLDDNTDSVAEYVSLLYLYAKKNFVDGKIRLTLEEAENLRWAIGVQSNNEEIGRNIEKLQKEAETLASEAESLKKEKEDLLAAIREGRIDRAAVEGRYKILLGNIAEKAEAIKSKEELIERSQRTRLLNQRALRMKEMIGAIKTLLESPNAVDENVFNSIVEEYLGTRARQDEGFAHTDAAYAAAGENRGYGVTDADFEAACAQGEKNKKIKEAQEKDARNFAPANAGTDESKN